MRASHLGFPQKWFPVTHDSSESLCSTKHSLRGRFVFILMAVCVLNQLNLPLQLLFESDVIMGRTESHLLFHLTPGAFCLLPKAGVRGHELLLVFTYRH